ncbi:MAG: hypothetical protein U1E84_09910 [Rhodoferax sp.]
MSIGICSEQLLVNTITGLLSTSVGAWFGFWLSLRKHRHDRFVDLTNERAVLLVAALSELMSAAGGLLGNDASLKEKQSLLSAQECYYKELPFAELIFEKPTLAVLNSVTTKFAGNSGDFDQVRLGELFGLCEEATDAIRRFVRTQMGV